MNDTKVLIEKIKEGIQEKKGKKIVVADLTSMFCWFMDIVYDNYRLRLS